MPLLALPLLAALLAPLGQVWTVDDDRPADFSDLPAAVAAAAAGDTLLLAPGTYSGATITRSLAILASQATPRPRVLGHLDALGPAELTLVGLELRTLRLQAVTGRARMDDCLVQGGLQAGVGSFVVRDCPEVLLTRSEAHGWSGTYFNGTPALAIFDSTVVVADCLLVGADGNSDPILPDAGYDGIACFGDVDVTVAGCTILGGSGGYGLSGSEPGAPAIGSWTSGVQTLDVRGSSRDVLRAGSGSSSTQAVSWFETYLWSGVTMVPGPGPMGQELLPAEPFLRVGGADLPGGARRFRLHGPAGAPALLALSSGAALASIPGVAGGPLWLEPAAIFAWRAVTLAGQETAATVLFPLPGVPGFVGLEVDAQAVVLMGPGGLHLTNPGQLVARF